MGNNFQIITVGAVSECPDLAYLSAAEQVLGELIVDYGADVLHLAQDVSGTVCAVYEVPFRGGKLRTYRAYEFTIDGDSLVYQYGYSTTERGCYMGKRYDVPTLWGNYHAEVFTSSDTPPYQPNS